MGNVFVKSAAKKKPVNTSTPVEKFDNVEMCVSPRAFEEHKEREIQRLNNINRVIDQYLRVLQHGTNANVEIEAERVARYIQKKEDELNHQGGNRKKNTQERTVKGKNKMTNNTRTSRNKMTKNKQDQQKNKLKKSERI